MKLVMCLKCEDVVRLILDRPRWCECKLTGGIYRDGVNADVWGKDAFVLGFENRSLIKALKNRPDRGDGARFEAFVTPRECPSVKFVRVPKSIKELCDGKIITE